MNALRRMLAASIALWALWSIAPRLAAAGESIRVGVAETDITPPNGFPMAGYYHERLAAGTRDPLKAKAVVFRGEQQQAALVVCDLIGIAVDLSTEVRRRASTKTGIPAAHIVVAATHSHTAPDYTKELFKYLGTNSDASAKPSAGADAGERQRYIAKLIAGIVEAIERAHAAAQPIQLAAGSAAQPTAVSFNRRFVTRDGSVRTWMSMDHPDVIRPAGPIDPEIGLLSIKAGDGARPLGVLSNFALHLDTVGGTQWSADYPFFLEQALRESLGKEVISIFGTGCCGDINHVDPTRRERNKTDVIGNSLAATVQSGLKHMRAIERPELRVRSAVVRVPLQDVTVDQLEQSKAVLAQAAAGKQPEFFTHVTAYKSLVIDQLRHRRPPDEASKLISWGLSRTWAGIGAELPVDVTVFTVGDDLALVCLPGEVFVDLGLAIKRASPFRTTMVIELSNCVETIYIPTRAAYASGSYEVTNASLQPGAGEMLVEAAIRLLRDAASEAAQARRPAAR